MPYNTFCLNNTKGGVLPERERHRERTSSHLLRWFMGRDPKRKQSSGEMSVILFDIKQNLKWPKIFYQKSQIRNFHENSSGGSDHDRQGRKDRHDKATNHYLKLYCDDASKMDSNVNNKVKHLYVFDVSMTVHHWYNNINNQLDATITINCYCCI